MINSSTLSGRCCVVYTNFVFVSYTSILDRRHRTALLAQNIKSNAHSKIYVNATNRAKYSSNEGHSSASSCSPTAHSSYEKQGVFSAGMMTSLFGGTFQPRSKYVCLIHVYMFRTSDSCFGWPAWEDRHIRKTYASDCMQTVLIVRCFGSASAALKETLISRDIYGARTNRGASI